MNIPKEFWDALLKGDWNVLVPLTCIILLIWFYKEMRRSFVDLDQIEPDRLDNAIIIYMEIRRELGNLIAGQDRMNELNDKIIKASPYLTYELIMQFESIKWGGEEEELSLKELEEKFKSEIYYIKSLQRDSISNNPGSSFLKSVERLLKKINFNSFIQPLVFLTALFIIIFTIIIAEQRSINQNIVGKIEYLFIFGAIVSDYMFAAVFIDLLLENRFIHNKNNWFFITLCFILPTVLLFMYPKVVGIINTIVLWVYIFKFYPKSIKKKNYIKK